MLKSIPIKSGQSIFELGCGTGAVLKRIRQVYGPNVIIGGSDLSYHAIEKARKVFPDDEQRFSVLSMTQTNHQVPDNSQDIVLSVGAFAMYLYQEDMEIALEEILRITKPGGHICLTTFVEPGQAPRGSILEPIEKSQWLKWANRYSLENMIIQQMNHQVQGDRYFVCFSKKQ